MDYKNKAVSDTAYGAYSSKGEGHLQEWKERGSVYHVILPDSMIEKEAAMACNILKVKNDIKSGGHNWKLIKVRSLDRSDAEMRNFPFLKRKVLKYHICTDYYLYDSNQKKYIAFVRMDDQSYPVFPQEKETTTSFVSKYYVDLEGERVAPVLPYWEICAPDSLEEAILNELKSMIGEKK